MALLTAKQFDYALLPIDGIYNMGPSDAMSAAQLIQAKKQKNLEKFNPPNKLVMKEGDAIYL